MAGAAVVLCYLAAVPVATLLYASFHAGFLSPGAHWSAANYARILSDPAFYRLFANTLLYGSGVALLALAAGFGLAFLFVRTDAPFRGLGVTTALVPLIVPGILNTVAWLFLTSPRIGILNAIAQTLVRVRPFNVFSMPGMIFVQAMHVAPTAFIMAVATFTSMDPSMEEAALASGAPRFTAFRRITLALARPAIVAAGLLVFIQTISSFEVPQLIGVPANVSVFTTQIYGALQAFPPDYGGAAAIGGFVLALAAAGVALINRCNRAGRYATVSGKAFRPRRIELGRFRPLAGAAIALFFAVVVAMPMAVLVWSSLLPGFEAPSLAALHRLTFANYAAMWGYPLIRQSLVNSAITSVTAGAIVTLLTAIVAYITIKSRIRGAWLLDVFVSLPIAVPSILMGVGILFWYLVAPLPFHLYGTLALLIVGFVTIGIPYGMRYLSAGFAQIRDELEDAATVSGADWAERFLRIYVPLLVPSLLAAFLTTVIVAFREISAAIFLYSQGTEVVSIAIFDLWSNGQYPAIAALGCILVALLLALVAIVQRFGGGIGMLKVSALGALLLLCGTLAPAAAASVDPNAAVREGVVVWYATMNTKDMDETAGEFMRTHPGIKVESLRLGSAQLPARIVTEQRGGKFNADVISGDFFQVSQLAGVGVFDKYVPPESGKFLKGTVDPNGFWTNLYQNTTVIAWNPQRLAADHLKPPASFADFAKPEWRGKFGFDTGAVNWYAGILQRDKTGGADLAKRIADNAPVKTAGHTQTVSLLEAGEFDATPTAYGYMAYQEKHAGKAIDFKNPVPLFVTLNPIGLAKSAPHPNAARAFIDWLTSKAGQTYIVERGGGEVSSRIDVRNNPQIFDTKQPFMVLDIPSAARYNELNARFRALLGLPGL